MVEPVYSRPSDTARASSEQNAAHTRRASHNRKRHANRNRRFKELREENERLHRRLAAIYDALSLD